MNGLAPIWSSYAAVFPRVLKLVLCTMEEVVSELSLAIDATDKYHNCE
jgi:hypothetical protein